MPAEIYDVEQCSPDWFRLRLGLPTASEFATVMAKGRDGGASVSRKKYLNTLAAEIITGEPGESYTNPFMERGKAMEAEARDWYEVKNPDIYIDRCGFVRNGQKGCSPDALLGADGMLEIKTRLGHLQVDLLAHGRFPPEHKAQCQGGLWVAEREWIDFICYSPGLPIFRHRLTRDEPYIKTLDAEVARFNEELAAIVDKVRRYGEPRPTFTEQLKASLALETM